MSIINTLLELDKSQLQLPTKTIEIKRLSEIAGNPVQFKVSGVSPERVREVREMNKRLNPETKEVEVDSTKMQAEMLLTGIVEPNLRDAQLLKHYNAITPHDVLNSILNIGEQEAIYAEIAMLTGYGVDTIEEVKKQ
ncbi:phage tail assembly chaperone [Paenibacillus apiarius]|uniref:phage tail assembly chaperone n=1 Tax=Paenibacillus apiarius TaxID=46240 RepID=UPI003B3B1122